MLQSHDPTGAIAGLHQALYHDLAGGAEAGRAAFAEGAAIRLCHPLGDLTGWDGLWSGALAPLAAAMPDAERRDYIRIAGEDHDGALWIGSAGLYLGSFIAPFLGIPPTQRVAHMRFHEFFRVEAGRIVEMQAIWDLPELMMQAGAWPMAPSLGRDWCIPGPADGSGQGPHGDEGAASCAHVVAMLEAMIRHPGQGGPEVMELDRFWHPKMMWYGPAGIGTGRGTAGFRHHHQIPFLKAMPDRGAYPERVTHHFFGEGAFVGVTGWPNMAQTIAGDGWLGIAPAGQEVTLRSLDFWRLEDGLIRENWVLVDLLDLYRQIGVDVMARMRELPPRGGIALR
ncbi:ester cyclase [Dinoroseobacter sp. S124A]|uniref:nuclear transport factor 2 family protein n=1 Tax=Dinoroseobacter sp. S124A TaxID=3415128 RepID=UPI003C79A79C